MKIHLTILNDGSVRIDDVIGAGAGCQAATFDIETLLGKVDESTRQGTSAAYEKNDPLVLKNDTQD